MKGGRLRPIDKSASIHYQLAGVPAVIITPEAFKGAVAGYQAIQPSAPAEEIWEDIWTNLTDSWESTPDAESVTLTPDGRTFLPSGFTSAKPFPRPRSVLTVRQSAAPRRDSAADGSSSPAESDD